MLKSYYSRVIILGLGRTEAVVSLGMLLVPLKQVITFEGYWTIALFMSLTRVCFRYTLLKVIQPL